MSRDPEPHGAVDKFEGDSKQPLGHQVLAYRNVMRCKWAVRKTARPKNGGRLAAQIRATKSEARLSGFAFCGPDSGSQNGPRFRAEPFKVPPISIKPIVLFGSPCEICTYLILLLLSVRHVDAAIVLFGSLCGIYTCLV